MIVVIADIAAAVVVCVIVVVLHDLTLQLTIPKNVFPVSHKIEMVKKG